MKIVAFIFNLSKGGAQGVFVNVVNYLYEMNYDVTVAVQNLDDPVYQKDLYPEIPVVDFGIHGAKNLFPKLKEYVEKNEFDLAFSFSPEISVNLCWVRSVTRKKFAIIGRCINTLSYEYKYADTFFRKYVTKNLVKLFYHKVDCSIAQSKGMGKDLIENYGFKKSQVHTINNALGVAFEREMNRTELPDKGNFMLYAGRLEPQKGLFMLLDSFAKIQDKTIQLKLIGEGSQKEELIEYVKKHNLENRVEFVNHTKKMVDYYRAARLTVLSSYFEGFPNVLVESIACGTPVVSFDLPSGPEEIIINGKNGYLTKYLNTDDLADKIDRALQQDWNVKEIKDTAKRYERERIFQQYVALIQMMQTNKE